jgi:putative membrane protein insertion efficiency factor
VPITPPTPIITYIPVGNASNKLLTRRLQQKHCSISSPLNSLISSGSSSYDIDNNVVNSENNESDYNVNEIKSSNNNGNNNNNNNSENDGNVEEKLKQIMLSWIRWYRETLSPIMPPNCRFQPSCSNYAIDSIELFGPIKGGVLTAWRLIRCNPIGGHGYDPPRWPPPGFFAGSNTKNWF